MSGSMRHPTLLPVYTFLRTVEVGVLSNMAESAAKAATNQHHRARSSRPRSKMSNKVEKTRNFAENVNDQGTQEHLAQANTDTYHADTHQANDTSPIEDISFLEKVKFLSISLVLSLALLLKLGGLWLWNSKKYFITKRRDKPPRCLVDASLGHHSYIKLKCILPHCFYIIPDYRSQEPSFGQTFFGTPMVIAVDLRGFGDSEKPVWRRKYCVDELVQELADFITTLGGGESSVVIGHDLGALLGWFLLQSHPKLVKCFISISCPYPNVFWKELPTTALFNLRFIQECQLPFVAEIRMMQQDLAILDQYLSHLPAVSSAQGVVSRETYKSVWMSRLKKKKDPCEIPLMLVLGDSDNSCSLEAAIRSTEEAEKLIIRVIDNAGHFPHQQAPVQVNRLILSFLAVPEGRVGCTSSSPVLSQKGLVNRMFGALTSTVSYGNHVLESVTKRSPLDPPHNHGQNGISIPHYH
ncbi:hypothetical protein B566_EDAN002205 [Ephemera danica]|nr:hypothetical protein B566_EDAN002205 [Ephemera danica]